MTEEDKNYKRLCQAIVIQAMKDYVIRYNKNSSEIFPYRREIDAWVNDMTGTFKLCAGMMDMTEKALQEMMLNKMDDIRLGGKLK